MNRKHFRLLALTSVGGVLEFYDFIIFALFASVLAHAFFPMENKIASLLATFATFAVGYLARPLGGLFFGHFGDKLGRKKTFMISIMLMGGSTLLLALVPTYQMIGLAGPILLITLRLIQGISVGGEVPGALTYISEWMPKEKGMASGVVMCFLVMGIVIGALVKAILLFFVSNEFLLRWGWRLPFLFGGLLGFYSYFARRKMEESPIYQALGNAISSFPIRELFHKHLRHILAGAMITGASAMSISLFFLFTPSYLKDVLHHDISDFMWYKVIALFFSSVLCIVAGHLSDRYHRSLLYAAACIAVIVFSIPVFYWYHQATWNYIPSLIISMLVNASLLGVLPSILVELFPARIRYSGVAITYNLGFAVFAGLGPLICMVIIHYYQHTMAPSLVLMASAILGLLGLVLIKKRPIEDS